MARFKILADIEKIKGLPGRFKTGYFETDNPEYIAILRKVSNSVVCEMPEIEKPKPEPIPEISKQITAKSEKKEVSKIGKYRHNTK
jgi:hypothetical protein